MNRIKVKGYAAAVLDSEVREIGSDPGAFGLEGDEALAYRDAARHICSRLVATRTAVEAELGQHLNRVVLRIDLARLPVQARHRRLVVWPLHASTTGSEEPSA